MLFFGKQKAFLACLGAEGEMLVNLKSFDCSPVLERLPGSVYWAMVGLSDLLQAGLEKQ